MASSVSSRASGTEAAHIARGDQGKIVKPHTDVTKHTDLTSSTVSHQNATI